MIISNNSRIQESSAAPVICSGSACCYGHSAGDFGRTAIGWSSPSSPVSSAGSSKALSSSAFTSLRWPGLPLRWLVVFWQCTVAPRSWSAEHQLGQFENATPPSCCSALLSPARPSFSKSIRQTRDTPLGFPADEDSLPQRAQSQPARPTRAGSLWPHHFEGHRSQSPGAGGQIRSGNRLSPNQLGRRISGLDSAIQGEL